MKIWSLTLLACSFQTVFLSLLWIKARFKFSKHLYVFSFFYWMCFVLGPTLAFLIYKISGTYKLDDALVLKTTLVSAGCYYVSLITYFLSSIITLDKKLVIFPTIRKSQYDVIAAAMLFWGIVAIALYVVKNHGFVLFKEGGYENRYESNVGLGMLSILFQLYIPGTLFFFLNNPSKKRFLISFALTILYGSLIYVALGGYRQLALGGLLTILLAGYFNNIIGKKTLAMAVPGTFFMLMALAVIRYKNYTDVVHSDIFWTIFIYYLADSIAPFDSFANILLSSTTFKYFELILNHFARLIPRAVWSGKPELIMNSGNYYTQNIIHYDIDVTISPTLNGELYLSCGYFGLIIGFIAVGLLVKAIDSLDLKNNKIHQVYFYSNFFITFWLVREGIEVLLERLVITWLLTILFILMTIPFVGLEKGDT